MKHYCLFEFDKEKKTYRLVDSFDNFEDCDLFYDVLTQFVIDHNFPVYYFKRCLEQDEFDDVENYNPFNCVIILK